MSLKKLGHSVLDTLGNRSKKLPNTDEMSQQDTSDHKEENRAKALAFFSDYIDRSVSPYEVPTTEQVATLLDLYQDRHGCDIILVCVIMRHCFRNYRDDVDPDDVVEIIKARDNHRYTSFDYELFHTFLKITDNVTLLDERNCPLPELYPVVSQGRRWNMVGRNFDARMKRDEGDQEENSAWAIWTEAKSTLADLRKNKQG